MIIKNRSEIIFLYDVKDNNPNGDPLNENKPRIDEETNENYVTDVRLKRTIRDYIANLGNQAPNKIFMRAERKKNKCLESMKEISDKFKDIEELIAACIDIRLFGGTLALKSNEGKKGENNHAITGPTQFRIGRSMHRVVLKENQITRQVPNDNNVTQGTFGFDQKLYYSLLKFYGVINENTAKSTNLTEQDVQLLLKAMWQGTKELNTRSKIGHSPRLLIKIDYVPGFFIGDLDSKVKLVKNNENTTDEQIRSTEDYKIDLTNLENALNSKSDKLEKIYMAKHEDLQLTKNFEVNKKTIIDLQHENWF
ncbi:MAG: type I-B CRISPR-associated protein Cas7/Csh2 [bacterium]